VHWGPTPWLPLVAACGTMPAAAEAAATTPSYTQALQDWRKPEELSAWAGQRFSYDAARALQFSVTQRSVSTPPAIADPAAFFEAPVGVCLDLSRFAVETLRQIDPQAEARYLMIEFEPVMLNGHTLRLHWIASFRRDGQIFFFADSERPGHIAGPYATAQAFIDDYAAYRGRPVVRFLELDSLQRQPRTLASQRPETR
jgi:hypothetical protein